MRKPLFQKGDLVTVPIQAGFPGIDRVEVQYPAKVMAIYDLRKEARLPNIGYAVKFNDHDGWFHYDQSVVVAAS